MPKAPFPYIRGHSFNLKILMWLMKNQMNWIWILVALFLFGCGNGKQKESDGLITVDVSKSYPKKELILQDLFDIEYVPLETTDEFVTAGDVVYFDENLMWIGNYRTDELQLLDRQGNFIRTINRKGQSGEEYISYNALSYDPLTKEVYISDSLGKKVIIYDTEGNFRRSFKVPERLYFEWIGDLNSEYVLCWAAVRDLPNDPNAPECQEILSKAGFMLMSKKDGSIRKINIPIERYASPYLFFDTPRGKVYSGFMNKTLTPYHGDWLLTEISTDTLFLFSPDYDLKPFIVRTPSATDMNPPVYLFTGAMTDRYYFLQTVENAYDTETGVGFTTRDLFYDKTEGEVYEYVAYNGDFTDERPLNLVCKFRSTMLAVNEDDVAFVSRIDAPDLVEAYNDGKLRGPLKEIASRLDEEDNPVILIAKYKR